MHVDPVPQRPDVTVLQYEEDVRLLPNEASCDAIGSPGKVRPTILGAVMSGPPPYVTCGNGNRVTGVPLVDDVLELDPVWPVVAPPMPPSPWEPPPPHAAPVAKIAVKTKTGRFRTAIA
jgi:hypothetical protein